MGIRGQYKNKRDANEADLFAIIRGAGIAVEPLDTPCDAVCGFAGHNYLVEIKNGPKAPLTAPQAKFHSTWVGQIVTIRTEEEARAWATNVIKSYPHQFGGTIS